VQTTNLNLFGRRFVLASFGLAFLGVDAVPAFVQHAVERGKIVKADAQ
jgi:hypothetical protein